MEIFNEVSIEGVVIGDLWPVHSLDLTPRDSFFLGVSKR
jgi:hypothetical protein